ncbi:MAG: putative metal-binding motif-containing protein, partial [bacterium]
MLAAGTHTLAATLEGELDANGEQLRVQVTATVEYGTDWDGDGYTDTALSGTDCDDGDASINPGAAEIWYDGVDQDCDRRSDYDADRDGYGSDAYWGRDCDDFDATINPAAAEVWYDGVDQD